MFYAFVNTRIFWKWAILTFAVPFAQMNRKFQIDTHLIPHGNWDGQVWARLSPSG